MSAGLEHLLHPKSVGIVGISRPGPGKSSVGGMQVLSELAAGQYSGAIYPVHPTASSFGSLPAFPSLAELPTVPDVLVIARPAATVPALAVEAAKRGVRGLVVMSSGFGELGTEEGHRNDAALRLVADQYGLAICGPNSLGLINAHTGAYLSNFAPLERRRAKPGGLAIVSHSGALAGSLIGLALDRGVGLSYAISGGNELTLTAADYVRHLAHDDRVTSLSLYLEGATDGRALIDAVAEATAAGKPVVALKVGDSPSGARAAISHTAKISGEQNLYRAALEQAGASLAHSLEELVQLPMYRENVADPTVPPRRACVISLSGGLGAVVADEFSRAGIDVPELQPQTRAALAALDLPLGRALRHRRGGPSARTRREPDDCVHRRPGARTRRRRPFQGVRLTSTTLREPVIAGVGLSECGRVPHLSPRQHHALAARRALDDAGLDIGDVDGYMCADERAPDMAEYLGIDYRYMSSTWTGGSSFEYHLQHATAALRAGHAETVLITYGSDQLSRMGRSLGTSGQTTAKDEPTWGQYEAQYGLTTVGSYALMAQRHMHEFGTTAEQLAQVAVDARTYAAFNPQAMYRDPLTIEQVVSSRLIADPLHKFDCCVVSDGGGAVVLTTRERGADLRSAPIHILGSGTAQTHWNPSQVIDYTSSGAVAAGATAFGEAGLTPADVDMAMLYDSFTITVLILLEGLGFCGRGESGPFVAGGNIGAKGTLPINTDGGGLSACHPGLRGMFLLVEAVRQLRGEAGDVQVPNCEVALAAGSGGWLSCIGVNILGKEPRS